MPRSTERSPSNFAQIPRLRLHGGWHGGRPFKKKSTKGLPPVTDVSPFDNDESEADAPRTYEKYSL